MTNYIFFLVPSGSCMSLILVSTSLPVYYFGCFAPLF